MSERIVLDPEAAVSGRTELDVTPWVGSSGLDDGDAAMEAYKAEGTLGEDVIDFRLPNRSMALPLVLRDAGGTTLTQIRSLIQAKAALWQREGGALGRYTSGGTAYATVVAAGLTLGGDVLQALGKVDANAVLEAEALPGWEEQEVELSSHEEKSATELIFTEGTIEGDMPAACRVEVTEKQGVDQKGLIWAFRSRYYSSAATAKTAYLATELTPLGESTKAALSGAAGGSAIANTALPPVWTPVVGTNLGGTFLTHKGTNRLLARVYSPQGTAVSVRAVWDVGDLVYPSENSPWTFPGGSAFYVADLGEVRLDPPPVGPHRWQGQIQAQGTEGGEDVYVDKVWLVNEDEAMGILSSPPQSSSTTTTVKAWDNFNATTSGTITGKVAPLGGTWTGAGDAVGFTVDTTNKWIKREEKSDAANTGRFERLGAGTATTVDVSLDVQTQGKQGAGIRQGIFARYSSTSNWLMVAYASSATREKFTLELRKNVAGTITVLGKYSVTSSNLFRKLRLVVDTSGNISVYEGLQSGTPVLVISAADSALAEGGALESGGYGIYDEYTGSTSSVTREYDNFYVVAPTTSTPTADAVIYASQKAQLTTQGHYRLDSGGTAYGPISRVIGDLPRLPPTTGERTTEVFIKASRGDFDLVADSGIDDIAAQVFYKPTWLTFPS